jgi:hypothetical protein
MGILSISKATYTDDVANEIYKVLVSTLEKEHLDRLWDLELQKAKGERTDRGRAAYGEIIDVQNDHRLARHANDNHFLLCGLHDRQLTCLLYRRARGENASVDGSRKSLQGPSRRALSVRGLFQFRKTHCAGLVAGLEGVRVEDRLCEQISGIHVHRDKELASLHG